MSREFGILENFEVSFTLKKLSFIEESLVILEDGNYSLFTGSFLDTGNSIFYDDSSGESFYRFSIDEIQAARNSHL